MHPLLLSPAATVAASASTNGASSDGLGGGIVGFAANVTEALGEWGVGLLTLIETLFPPIPSEVILPLAGYLSTAGDLNLVLLIVTTTLGALVGAMIFYGLGAVIGLKRAIDWAAMLPLVDREDFEKAAEWFFAHGRGAVFYGRFVPGVRSLISLPAGAARMNIWVFFGLTTLGAGIWNSILILLGAALGTQYELVEKYSEWLDYAVYAVLIGLVLWLVIRRILRVRASKRAARLEAERALGEASPHEKE